MEDYIIRNCEAEGHLDYFKDRKVIWEIIKNSKLTDICETMTTKFNELKRIVANNSEKQMEKQMKWTAGLTNMAKETDSAMNEDVDRCPDRLHHFCCIFHTMGKYAYVFLSKEDPTMGTNQNTDHADLPVSQQTDSGLLVLGSGCIGQMFRLYKRNKPKYHHLMKPLVAMIVKKKKSVFVPVEQTSRDRGGLYVIRSDFLSPLRILDTCLRQQFAKVSQHGHNIIKEVTKKVKTLSVVADSFMCQFPAGIDSQNIQTVVETFIRKYTNARIGGFVKGGAERHAEKKGQRFKGGGTLREKLTHVAGTKGNDLKKNTKGMKTDRSSKKNKKPPNKKSECKSSTPKVGLPKSVKNKSKSKAPKPESSKAR